MDNLNLNPLKCNLFCREVCNLCHIISSQGVRKNLEKIPEAENWDCSAYIQQLGISLVLSTYHRTFAKGFSSIDQSLQKLTESNQNFIWTEEYDKRFKFLKDDLKSVPILAYSHSENRLILCTDVKN